MKRIVGTASGILLALSLSTQGNAFSVETVGGPGSSLQKKQVITLGISPKKTAPARPVLLAQSTADNAVQVNQLQELVRKLNGQVEELSFQLLQLQEQIRKMQEDNEFRFQELEDKHSDAGAVKNKAQKMAAKKGEKRLGKTRPSEVALAGRSSGGNKTSKTLRDAGRVLGLPAQNLGTLRFDANGNVIESAVGKPLDLTSIGKPFDGQNVPGVDITDLRPATLLARGRDFYDAGDYALAERTLYKMIKSYPENQNRAEAQYWIGRSLFARGKFHSAATIFLDTHNAYPDSRQAPDTLLRLGLSMAGLNQREIACATYAEVGKQFPNADKGVKEQVRVEQKSAGCR